MPLMPEKILYEYAVVRYVPRVEREEFLNVGLVMMCKRRRWLKVMLSLDNQKIKTIFPDADIDTLREQLKSFEDIAGGRGPSPIASLEAHERFRWLTAVRSASITTSRPHPGICHDLDTTFESLKKELVL